MAERLRPQLLSNSQLLSFFGRPGGHASSRLSSTKKNNMRERINLQKQRKTNNSSNTHPKIYPRKLKARSGAGFVTCPEAPKRSKNCEKCWYGRHQRHYTSTTVEKSASLTRRDLGDEIESAASAASRTTKMQGSLALLAVRMASCRPWAPLDFGLPGGCTSSRLDHGCTIPSGVAPAADLITAAPKST